MSEDVAKILGGSFVVGCFLLSLGFMVGSKGPSYLALRALGEEIGHGIAHAACIDSGGEWGIETCRKGL